MMKMMDKILNNYPLTSMHGLEYNPCKQEDFRNLSDDLNIDEEALFLHHVDSRWLTLALVLERVLKRWEDAKEYFLQYIPSKKEYKQTLSNNKRYQTIQSN